MNPVHYHDETKHHFRRFARSAGHLDWATQPDLFRRFEGAPILPLVPVPAESCGPPVPYDGLFVPGVVPPAPLDARRVSEFFRFSLGLSAWKRFGGNRWALRVNPSSGNLHPTEGYAILGSIAGLSDEASVCHYAPEAHTLERRCAFPLTAWHRLTENLPAGACLAALTSIHWREAWKYGERAFRYCQHDVGHAIGALSFSAAVLGWRLTLLPDWSDEALAALLGLERDGDFDGAEREEPDCLMLVSPGPVGSVPGPAESAAFVEAVRAGRWSGRANRLSAAHVDWPIIDEVARATRRRAAAPVHPGAHNDAGGRDPVVNRSLDARRVILQRRSAQAYDGVSEMSLESFVGILRRTMPANAPPWNALWWPAAIHLALFVHRVRDLEPGLYMLVRRPEALDELRAAMRPEFAWVGPAAVPADLPLFTLARGNCEDLASRLSCGQDIAGASTFSLGLIAEFESTLARHGPWFYRRLFWETGVIGQVLYLEAEASRVRGTGIGCYFDDPVHEVLGLTGHAFQSLYHFTVGVPLDDRRLMTGPGYHWEEPAPR